MLRMIRTFIISFLCIILSVSLFSEEQEGNLLARRVIEFWKEGDYSLAKDQAKNFPFPLYGQQSPHPHRMSDPHLAIEL